MLLLAVAFVVGAIPFAQIGSHLTTGVDLRRVGTGTVSGTALYRVAGFGPLAVAGVLEIGKGAVGPLLAGHGTILAALAGGCAVAGHNWSPFLRGAGGRGISPAMGALAVTAWPGSVLLLGGMAVGSLLHHTGAGSFVAYLLLTPLMGTVAGAVGVVAAVAVLAPILLKRIVGNESPPRWTVRTLLCRLLFDRDGQSVTDGRS